MESDVILSSNAFLNEKKVGSAQYRLAAAGRLRTVVAFELWFDVGRWTARTTRSW
jgi:hypothetical protein